MDKSQRIDRPNTWLGNLRSPALCPYGTTQRRATDYLRHPELFPKRASSCRQWSFSLEQPQELTGWKGQIRRQAKYISSRNSSRFEQIDAAPERLRQFHKRPLKTQLTQRARLLFRPQNALFFFRNWSQALVNKFLQALPAISFGRVDVALRIRGDAMHGVELPRLPSAVAETRQDLESVAQQDVHLLVRPIGEIDVLLRRVLRKSDIPNGTITQRPFFDDLLFDEGAVRLEYLDAIVHTVADVEQAIVRELRAVHRIAELLIDGRVRIVKAHVRVVRLVPVGSPMPLVLPGVGVKHDDTFVAIPVGDVQFIRLRIDEHFRRPFEIFRIVAALALEGMSNLHQEFPVLCELQNLIVGISARLTRFRHVAGPGILQFGIYRAAVSANPNIPFVVDGNSVVRVRPVVTLAGTAPVFQEVAGLIEFKNGRRGHAAIRSGWIRVAVGFLRLERATAMNDPDVVLRVHRYADRHADHPMVRQRLRPHRVHLKHGRLDAGGLHGGLSLQHDRSYSEPGNQYENRRTNPNTALHNCFSIFRRDMHLTRPPNADAGPYN